MSSPIGDQNGIVWISGFDGLIRFDTKMAVNDTLPFKVLIRKITAGKLALNLFLSGNNSPEVKFSNNTFHFDYAAPYFINEDKTKYQTELQGFDTAWSAWRKSTYREFTNLPYGDYVFKVRAKNVYGVISREADYSFTILPPWYRTWWAYIIYALIILAIIYWIVRWRTRELRAEHRKLERTVEERTADLNNRVKELAVINSVQDGLAQKLDMQSIYDMIGDKLREVFDAQAVIIGTFDEKASLEFFHYLIEDGKRFYADPRPLDKVRTQLIMRKKTIEIKNDKELSEWLGNVVVSNTRLPRSALFVPLFSQNKVNGYLSLQNLDRENAFSESDVKLLETLANSMSVALENARLFDETTRLLKETEQRNAELAVINSVQDGLANKLDMQSIYDLVGDRLRGVFPNINVLVIRTFNDNQDTEYFHYAFEEGKRMEASPQPISWVNKILVETRKPLLINKDYAGVA
ncbi:MAG: GAF domain-containing protein, partial [Chitinophagaceae bacterium]